MSDWQIYQVHPMDFQWEFMASVAETVSKAEPELADEIVDDFATAVALATATSWDRKFMQGPVVLWFPTPSENNGFQHAFAWKGGSNGTCFIASRLPLDWLAAESF